MPHVRQRERRLRSAEQTAQGDRVVVVGSAVVRNDDAAHCFLLVIFGPRPQSCGGRIDAALASWIRIGPAACPAGVDGSVCNDRTADVDCRAAAYSPTPPSWIADRL